MIRAAVAATIALLLTASCGSSAETDDADLATEAIETTTSQPGARSVASPGQTTDPALDSTATESSTTSTGGATTESPTTTPGATTSSAAGSSDTTPSSVTTDAASSTTTTSPTATSSSTVSSDTTTSTSATTTSPPPTSASTTTTASAPPPGRIDLPSQVASTEGVATDPSTGRVFVGELNNGNVWVGTLDADSFSLFASGSAVGRSTALGLEADQQRRRLYVVSPANNRVDVLDLDDGGLVTSISVPVGAGSVINDIAVAPDGTAYVTDTGRPSIYRIPAGTTSAELWVDYSSAPGIPTAGRTQHGNGVVANGSHVLVAYMTGGELLRFDRATGAVSQVAIAGAPTAGRDGLVRCGNRLYGVDIASLAGGQDTVWITDLSSDWATGSGAGSIRSSSFSSASTAALLDGSLVVVNAQFGVNPQQRPFWLTVEPASC